MAYSCRSDRERDSEQTVYILLVATHNRWRLTNGGKWPQLLLISSFNLAAAIEFRRIIMLVVVVNETTHYSRERETWWWLAKKLLCVRA